MNMEKLELGKYRHYKGHFYEVMAVGKDSESLEDVVIYMALYNSEEFGDNAVWVRSLKEFVENVEIDGNDVSRFKLAE